MKAKSLLAVLAAAAMLCTAVLPAYAEDTLPDAPAVVEQQAEEVPADDTQLETDTPEQKDPQNEVATLEASENEDDAGKPVVQETMAVVNVGGSWRNISMDATTYFAVNNGSIEDGTAQNYNVKIEFKNNDCYVTLKDAAFTKAADDQNYIGLQYEGNLYITLEGTNVLPGPIATISKLDINGTGALEVSMTDTDSYYDLIGGTKGVSIGGSVKIHGQNLGTKSVTGLYGENSFIIKDNAEVSLEGNLLDGIAAMNAVFQMNGGKLTVNGVKAQVDGENIQGGSGIYATNLVVNGGSIVIENTAGNGIQTNQDMTLKGGTVEIKNTTRAPYGQYGYGGNAITTGKNLNVTGGTLIIDKSANNDVFANSDLNITGGTFKLTNGAVALASHANIKISNANVSIENISGHALSAYIGDIEVVDSTFTLKNGGFDGAVTTSGNITVRGGKFTIDGAKRFGLHAGSGQNATNSDVIIDGAEVKINSVWPMLASPAGNVKISGKAKITGASSEGSALYSINNIQITGNDCEIEVTGAIKGAYANKGILFENADELVKMGGADATSAQPVMPEEMSGCQYLHIFKGKDLPREDDVVIDTKNWTEGNSANVPTIADKDGNPLKAKVYYKVKGADDSTYTETVPTAAGDYETKLVVLADGEYGEAVYYSAFTIVAKSTPSNGDNNGNGNNSGNSNTGNNGTTTTTTTVTATAPTPTPAPRAEAKAQSAPAAVTATIPQTSDTFPYAILATLMGAAALGMAGITILRKKRQ